MLRLPHTPIVFACWIVLWAMFVSLARVGVVAALRSFRRRRGFTECVRIAPKVTAPRFARDDPSPRRRP